MFAFAWVIACGNDATIEDSSVGDDAGSDTTAADTAPTSDATPMSDGPLADADGEAGAACTVPITCYGGAAGELTGANVACKAGTASCFSGSLGPCIGEVRPSGESCNGVDDDCNGQIDDGLGVIRCGVGACANTAPACASGVLGTCTPKAASAAEACDGIDNNCNGVIDEGCGCVYVAPFGSDTTGTGGSSTPFRTIGKAIGVAGTGAFPKQVCVAGTLTCANVGTTTAYNEAVTMRDGISVYGGYSPVGATWTRAGNCVTAITGADPNGVVFPVTVTTTTILDGFTIQAQNVATNAAITVTGSTGAVISNDFVDGAAGTSSVGILVQASGATKATPTIRNCGISGGTGSSSSIGVRSVSSAPVITRNCSSFDAAGRCTSYGCSSIDPRSIRGRTSGGTNGPLTQTYAVKLEASANALVDGNALCSSAAPGDVAGLHISGLSSGVLVRQNNIAGPGGMTGNVNGVGVWMTACGGASPWIVDNMAISGESRTAGGRGDGIRAVGDCHPRVDTNVRIVGGLEGAIADTIGVYCARDAASGIASRCTILGNTQILGSSAGFPPSATGVKCDVGACARIERNALISGNQGVDTFGIVLNGASTFVDRNVISAGCTTGEGIGILAVDSAARIQNNVIDGGASCMTGGGTKAPTSTYAVRILLAPGLKEVDLHSNDLFAGGSTGLGVACTSRALAFDLAVAGTPPSGPRGIVRNDILHAGVCATSFGLVEANAAADPRILQNNDFWYAATPTALYRDENANDLATIAAVNARSDITSAANLSADPLYTSASDFHLVSGSPCRNAGTNVGAPTADWEGDARPKETTSDIGADEFTP
jgi:hypothetical protein